ncbi:MAG: DNA repair protein RecN [Roseburia sp.]|jgi:DNA repair protein RecN (Recombination protein N)|nr:DNA repair protein RecN [Roseburia sp.]
MLQSLHVKNLALIDEAEVDFGRGLNILSGETGAGKSIIIGSINLALGGKIQKEMLREAADGGEAEPALVELIFTVEDERVRAKLEQLGVEPEDDEVILSRRIAGGRGAAKVNAQSVPASRVKEIAAVLIDIHGQHEHQSLLSKKKHLEILDDYAGEALAPKKKELGQIYRSYRKLAEELQKADVDPGERTRELSFLQYEIDELENAALTEGEDEELESDFRKFSNGKRIIEAVSGAYNSTGGDMGSATELVGGALRELSGVSAYDSQIEQLEQELLEIDNLLNDFNRELAGYIGEMEFDDETFYQVEKRLDEVNRLKAKYGSTIPEVLDALEQKKQRAAQLMDYDRYLEELKERVRKEETKLNRVSLAVSKIRKEAAEKLTKAVTEALKDLNFLEVRFQMQFGRLGDYTANGFDDAEFLISTNPGEPLKPLGKVASGGELSRIMLAVKTVLADADEVGTLIFDEIDSGISGRTAQMVSEKMNILGQSHQIICITHLPQIAAMADAHYLIEKSVMGRSTVSTIRRLKEEESVDELSRMLGGVEITETVQKSAKEMKALAKKKKNV